MIIGQNDWKLQKILSEKARIIREYDTVGDACMHDKEIEVEVF